MATLSLRSDVRRVASSRDRTDVADSRRLRCLLHAPFRLRNGLARSLLAASLSRRGLINNFVPLAGLEKGPKKGA